jgi:hypothetical protein
VPQYQFHSNGDNNAGFSSENVGEMIIKVVELRNMIGLLKARNVVRMPRVKFNSSVNVLLE